MLSREGMRSGAWGLAGVSCGVFSTGLTRLMSPRRGWTMIFVNSRTDFGVMPVKVMKPTLAEVFD